MKRFATYGLACFTALLLSSELALSLPIADVGPDLVIIVVVAFVGGEHPRTAAVSGFGAGLLRDLLLTAPAGLTAFAYGLTGYATALAGPIHGVGRFVGMVAGATFVSQTIYGVGTLLVAQQVDASSLPRVILITTFYNALVAPLLMPLLRRIALVERATAGTHE